MKPKIGVICSSSEMSELVRRVAEKIGIQVEARVAVLERAIFAGKDFEANGIEVIVSRGGTALILRDNLSIPVLFITQTAFDLLESVLEASKYGKEIGMMLCSTVQNMDIFERLFNVRIKQIIYHEYEHLRRNILKAKEEGVEVLIGGNLSCEIAEEIGMTSVPFGYQNSERAICNVLEEAQKVASIRREEKEKMKWMEAILNSISEGAVAINRDGLVTMFNKLAEDLLKIKSAVGLPIDKVIPELGLKEVLKTGAPKFHRLQQVGEIKIITNLVPIYLEEEVIGAIASFSEVSKVMLAEQKVRRSYTNGFVTKHTLSDIVNQSPAMKQVIKQIKQFAQSDSTLLITGESGTGKELVAHSIHSLSPRNKEPFVGINCSALSENLLESEIFGHEEGAFTGAKKGGKMGLFELAHNGTTFLDEIGAISEGFQARLLRVLQQKEIMKIGGNRIIPVDVRIIAATNKDLLTAVKEGRFRMDLYFRLNILKIHLPPLRERKEDIPYLAANFFNYFTKKYRRSIEPLPDRLVERFADYSWPGNIRELQNVIERFVLMAEKPREYEWILNGLFEECFKAEKILQGGGNGGPALTDENLRKLLSEANLGKEELARRLGISRTTLWRKLNRAAN